MYPKLLNGQPADIVNPLKDMKLKVDRVGDLYFLRTEEKKDNIASTFKAFGCEAFVRNNKKIREKFEPRALKGIFLGYSNNSKAYRIWLNEAKRVEISRSVKFLENNSLTPLKEYIDFRPYDGGVIKTDKRVYSGTPGWVPHVNNGTQHNRGYQNRPLKNFKPSVFPLPSTEKNKTPESDDDVTLEPELSISEEPINSEQIISKRGVADRS
ncbi:hypothetical protein AVEN_225193-1 [Araneus ventricosus]|uniref:Retroviral polymerase SH3-like domain-containing protein n=1 Tax=Araneus ventricosus TaxID=182803 RepID=A0A4Y2AMN8_ARAVE|nr:hypothetical protein AVEN_225193-1 [Araneus ventricosus]